MISAICNFEPGFFLLLQSFACLVKLFMLRAGGNFCLLKYFSTELQYFSHQNPHLNYCFYRGLWILPWGTKIYAPSIQHKMEYRAAHIHIFGTFNIYLLLMTKTCIFNWGKYGWDAFEMFNPSWLQIMWEPNINFNAITGWPWVGQQHSQLQYIHHQSCAIRVIEGAHLIAAQAF